MRRRNEGLAAAVFLLPYGALFTVFVLAPLLYGLWISLHNWHILSDKAPFVGLTNYRVAVQDELFRIALARTALFVAIVVPIGNVVSLLLAVALNQNFRGTDLFKVAFYMPVLTSVSVLAVLWRWLYSKEFGLLNTYLGTNVGWLGDTSTAMPAVALMSIWWGGGGNMLVYLAGLKAVPKELLEAAELDGARPVRRFFTTSLPLIKPVILFCLVMSVIASSQVFGQTYILTQGGPYNSTLTAVLYTYQQGFSQYQLGYGSALAFCLFAIVLVFTLVQFRLLRGGLKPG